jgi:dTDP-4-amino-4,6-dideoxygalactose transaminase
MTAYLILTAEKRGRLTITVKSVNLPYNFFFKTRYSFQEKYMQVPFLDLKAQYASISDEIQAAINEVLESQHFILGPKVEQLEGEVGDYCGCQFGIGVASGTDALLLSLMGLDVGPGDEIITSTYTFFATGGSISRTGAKPVFVDIDPETFNMVPEQVAAAVTDKTRAIIPVHLFGLCVEMDPIMETAKSKSISVIEDAAQAIGAKYKDRTACSIGDTGCLSFFPTKNLGGLGDGGMVVANDQELADKIRILRVHGSKPKYYHHVVGINSRLDSLQAACLLVKLKHLDNWCEGRRRNAAKYNELFAGTDVVTPKEPPHQFHVYNQYVVRVPDRESVQKRMKENNVGSMVYYPVPLHLQPCFADLGYKEGSLPESERASKESLALPIYPELTDEHIETVVKTVLGR